MTKHQFGKFIIIGIYSTIVNYGVFYVLLEFARLNYLLSSTAGFVVGVFAGYAFNKSWTFEVEDDSKSYLIKYYGVYLVSLGISLVFLNMTVGLAGFSAKLCNLGAIGITTATNFVGTKFLVFKK